MQIRAVHDSIIFVIILYHDTNELSILQYLLYNHGSFETLNILVVLRATLYNTELNTLTSKASSIYSHISMNWSYQAVM